MKILIVDDHFTIREGLKQIIHKFSPLTSLEETDNGIDALAMILNSNYDFVIMDISLPGMSGLDVLKNLLLQKNHTAILMLSMHPEEQYAIRSLKMGASGYITKDRAGEELLKAIEIISSGGKYISSHLAESIAQSFGSKPVALLHEKLSAREFTIMLLLANGKTTREIAGELCISEKTISTHRSRIMGKMQMKKNVDLTFYALKNKLIE